MNIFFIAQKLYKHMRHPIMLGIVLILWITPLMTLDRFLLSFCFTIYPILANKLDIEDVNFIEEQVKKFF